LRLTLGAVILKVWPENADRGEGARVDDAVDPTLGRFERFDAGDDPGDQFRLHRPAFFGAVKVHDVQPNHGWRHLWREIVRGTRMKLELYDYMCGHEGRSGTIAR